MYGVICEYSVHIHVYIYIYTSYMYMIMSRISMCSQVIGVIREYTQFEVLLNKFSSIALKSYWSISLYRCLVYLFMCQHKSDKYWASISTSIKSYKILLSTYIPTRQIQSPASWASISTMVKTYKHIHPNKREINHLQLELQSAKESRITSYYCQHTSQQHKLNHLHLELQSAQESRLTNYYYQHTAQLLKHPYANSLRLNIRPFCFRKYILWEGCLHDMCPVCSLKTRLISLHYISWWQKKQKNLKEKHLQRVTSKFFEKNVSEGDTRPHHCAEVYFSHLCLPCCEAN
jgi:hypothetical protein